MVTKRIIAFLIFLLPSAAFASTPGGETMSLVWGIPFAGMLLSIALFPLFLPGFWHHHFGKIAGFWIIVFLVPLTMVFGASVTIHSVVHALIAEYMPFILLLFALYTISGGILFWGTLPGSAMTNTKILALGAALASVMGTTGAAMLLIRPLIKANVHRQHKVHVIIFFIFLVANIGGGLTPLGDPPLFLGFLQGVDFMWTVKNMLPSVLFCSVVLLSVFYLIDRHFWLRDPAPEEKPKPVKLFGMWNILLLAGVVGAVLMSGIWKSNIAFDVFGTTVKLPGLMRDVLLLVFAGLSLWLTPKQVRAGNEFTWFPIVEVAKLFAAIFITITPVITILHAGEEGGLAFLLNLVSTPTGEPINAMYFWMTGLLSSCLDNAPTYLVFFNLASGDASTMMGTMGSTLLAISMGSVFMGAFTYIGNAPNFMVKSIAEHSKIEMPGFFGYMLWSCAILVPLYLLVTLIFFVL